MIRYTSIAAERAQRSRKDVPHANLAGSGPTIP